MWDEDRCVYIDRDANIRLSPDVSICEPFYDGYARVSFLTDYEAPSKEGFIDKTGSMVALVGVHHLFQCSEGIARFSVIANRFPGISRKFGYFDLAKGTILVPPIYDAGGEFSEGLARVNKGASNWNRGEISGGKWGFIDKAGKLKIPHEFSYVGDFHEGLAPASSHSLWGYIDQNGSWVIEPMFQEARPFSEGLASVQANGQWAVIDKKGNVVIQPQSSLIHSFSEGLARKNDSTNDKIGYIDRFDSFVINPQFASARDFSNGLASVSVLINPGEYKSGYIDKTGKFTIAPRSARSFNFQNGLAEVLVRIDSSHTKFCLIDNTGKQVWPPLKGK